MSNIRTKNLNLVQDAVVAIGQDAYFKTGSSAPFVVKDTTGASTLFSITNAGVVTNGASNFATEDYVDSFVQGLTVKASVRAATTVAGGNLSYSWSSGVFSGVTPTPTIDGVTLVDGDRVLIKNQTSAQQNGIYVFDDTANTLTRSVDFDQPDDNPLGSFIFVTEGTVNADSGWVCGTPGPVTFNTTPLTFTQFSSQGTITAGNGLIKTGSTLSVDAYTNIVVDSNGVSVTDTPVFSSITGGSTSGGDLTLYSTSNGTKGSVIIPDTTVSTNTTSGALVVGGGVGVAGATYLGGDLTVATNTFKVNSTSNSVGIGTTDPQAKLDIRSGDLYLLNNDSVSSTQIYFGDTAQTNDYFSIIVPVDSGITTGSVELGTFHSDAMKLYTENGSIKLLRNGNVGIGSESPTVRLDVDGKAKITNSTISTSTDGALFVTGGVGIGITNSATSFTDGGALTVVGGAAVGDNLLVQNSVGIGTTNPGSNKLQVEGAVKISSGGLDVTGTVSGSVANSTPSVAPESGSGLNIPTLSSDVTVSQTKLVKINDEYVFSCVIKVDNVSLTLSTTSFEIPLPSKTNPFGSNPFELAGHISGFYTTHNDATIVSNMENCIISNVPSTSRAKISFTSTDATTNDIYLQVIARYSA